MKVTEKKEEWKASLFLVNKKVVLELKTGIKYFGKVLSVDSSPVYWSWIELFDERSGKIQLFNDGELVRIEIIDEVLGDGKRI